MKILKFAAFSDGNLGGNPAGVVILDALPSTNQTQACAADVGFSETVFVAPVDGAGASWRTRYFSPESEVPFCGHATIALGAALAAQDGSGVFNLHLNSAKITVEGVADDDRLSAALQSPPTTSQAADAQLLAGALLLFGLDAEQLNPAIPPALIHAGADHLVLGLKTRADLAAMNYDLDAGRAFMREHGLVTIMLVFCDETGLFHVRNAFASGGVLEDPATGAAAAAFADYLRDLDWAHGGAIEIVQGEDMGARSLIRAEIGSETGSSIRVPGTVRQMS